MPKEFDDIKRATAKHEEKREPKYNCFDIARTDIQPARVTASIAWEIDLMGIHGFLSDYERVKLMRLDTCIESSIEFWTKQKEKKALWANILLVSDRFEKLEDGGLDAIKRFRNRFNLTRIIIVGTSDNDNITHWFKLGAYGYLASQISKEELKIAISAVNRGCYCIRLPGSILQVYPDRYRV